MNSKNKIEEYNNEMEEYKNELEEYIRNYKNTSQSQKLLDYMDKYRRKANNKEPITRIDTIIFKACIRIYIAELFYKKYDTEL